MTKKIGKNEKITKITKKHLLQAYRIIDLAMGEGFAKAAKWNFEHHFKCKDHGVDDGHVWFGYFIGNKLVGIIGLEKMNKGLYDVGLSWFAVHPQYQKQGIGTALLRYVESYAKRKGVKLIEVETYLTRTFRKAIFFYLSHGFKFKGTIIDFLPDGTAALYFHKKL